jgi:hypothetical protein
LVGLVLLAFIYLGVFIALAIGAVVAGTRPKDPPPPFDPSLGWDHPYNAAFRRQVEKTRRYLDDWNDKSARPSV